VLAKHGNDATNIESIFEKMQEEVFTNSQNDEIELTLEIIKEKRKSGEFPPQRFPNKPTIFKNTDSFSKQKFDNAVRKNAEAFEDPAK